MKPKYIITILVLCLVILAILGAISVSSTEDNSNHRIKLAEVTHSVFYAPMYVAIEKDYFKECGIDLELVLASGADKVAVALLSGEADVGLCGSEATIYVYNQGEKDYLKSFSQLTQKDGSFLISRKKEDNFKLADLKHKTIIGGRAAGMPEMTLEYILKQHGINPKVDVSIDTSVAFPAMAGAFIGGRGDYVTLFEPTATMLEKQGYGYVVASVGEFGGNVPYTSFCSKKSFIENNTEVIKSFNRAIQKGIDYVLSHSDEDVANVITKQFPDTSLADIADSVKRYRNNKTWPDKIYFSEDSFKHLQDIMIDYGELKSKVEYNKLIYSF